MSKRIRIKEVEPAIYKAMMALENYMATTKIEKLHKDLIKVRASQINGCTYCMDIHSREARQHGETEQRLYVLTNWRETDLFSEEEQAILAMTEEVTLLPQGVSDETYERAAKLFDEQYLAQLIMAIIAINAWNRIGVSTHMIPNE
ncbi:carboxymuconolactone decarboxylase family protein [Chitinophaga niabensis]|uniref:Alkylhydroperoxidase AhpD family core domain-containing protein n=1 Tax=Chitinophaga niabensis TaxID=536979 RepID=A0A1N6K3S3_9BACT|nr:carboxymuconolactone decarboxylase family protein [Chitinophaga niabensis]SIO51244.1 alkylhydroperoxidase AhpD family core domain-containing protein [Chitinophaga niabensis]